MESAIDPKLVCPRSLTRRVPDDYVPAYASFGHRSTTAASEIVMMYAGVQFAAEEQREPARAAVGHIAGLLGGQDGALHHDLSYYRDSEGFQHFMVVGYWLDMSSYERWNASDRVRGWWKSDDRLADGLGHFWESQCPRLEQFETIYGYQDDLPGAGAVLGGVSGEIYEHAYWGSMRERIPLSQTDRLQPSGHLTVVSGDPATGGRVTIHGHDNLTLIRSGQEWKNATTDERDYYLGKLAPVLVEGMDFLRDNGPAVGCYSNRFVQNVDADGNLLAETYNVGHWGSLSALERWGESHPTHLRIFASFISTFEEFPNLRLYHEVSVSDARTQVYEYINCHPATGLMRDAQ